MDDARPSLTAYRVALRRAAHQILDHPKILDDPLALGIVGAKDPGPRETGDRSSGLRAFVVLRSRYAEDELARAVQDGVSQYVLLGAGLDTFAYRNPHATLRVFEVDHPATQAWKRGQLAAAGIPIPENLTFVPVDFEKQTLSDCLVEAGFDARAMTFFSWLGVTPYLTRPAFEATLQYIAAMPAGSGLVFDFAASPDRLSPAEQIAFDALSARVASAGEPFQLFFDPPALVEELHHAGFRQVELLDRPEMNARYFANRTDGFRISGSLGKLIGARI